jgi:hypothetical protein
MRETWPSTTTKDIPEINLETLHRHKRLGEFGVKMSGENLPAKPGQILMKGEEKDVLSASEQSKYRSGVGKLRYLATWSRPDILNAVREVSRCYEPTGCKQLNVDMPA